MMRYFCLIAIIFLFSACATGGRGGWNGEVRKSTYAPAVDSDWSVKEAPPKAPVEKTAEAPVSAPQKIDLSKLTTPAASAPAKDSATAQPAQAAPAPAAADKVKAAPATLKILQARIAVVEKIVGQHDKKIKILTDYQIKIDRKLEALNIDGINKVVTSPFNQGSAQITNTITKQLDVIVKKIKTKTKKNVHIFIEGLASITGRPENNQKLAWQRAQTVKKYLEEEGGGLEWTIEAVGIGSTNRMLYMSNNQSVILTIE
ncbi:hypothetical protein COX69_03165 [Candidatus Falkowbacteria bacterium CG_4_10_14_0_2_um_filter_48_10]|uniref:OmpA-like domain-containing protein n=1 Tax=Candidatus Falkowbacteria bacterium CG23_combo_of_CG06-09_8_20_14_all_49_15 TaxID=1974572 RepID=A0A2G9ZLW0_9BACT|nr:MAG: hypothetical protein COX22_00470 [Candidatus Falkowbacteria bacterium CG23_combo_of_CG06-09_8_20_14_all_49_15]PJA08103.1 MAG: hypothetical protein COX69_03165 [Candidatus Falkowbacteria bacterium CG_4_10_14_0_2_um_filter_48_10]